MGSLLEEKVNMRRREARLRSLALGILINLEIPISDPRGNVE